MDKATQQHYTLSSSISTTPRLPTPLPIIPPPICLKIEDWKQEYHNLWNIHQVSQNKHHILTEECKQQQQLINKQKTKLHQLTQSNQILKERELTWHTVFKKINQFVLLLTTVGKIVNMSQVAEKMCASNRVVYLKKWIWETSFFDEKSITRLKEQWSFVEKGAAVSCNVTIQPNANYPNKTNLAIGLHPIKNNLGEVLYILMEGEESTDFAEKKQTIFAKNQVIDGLVQNFPVLYYRFDQEGTIKESVGLALRRIGLEDHEVVGQNIFKLYQGVDRVLEPHRKTLNGESLSYLSETPLLDGTIAYYQTSIFPDKVNQGGIGFAYDITPLKKIEQALAQKIEELDDKNQELQKYIDSNLELENFAYVTSHDLKEPLRTITGFAQLLSRRYKDKLDANGEEFIQYIVGATNSMKCLIDDLLTYSRANTTQHFTEQIVPEMMLAQICNNLKRNIKESHTTITTTNFPVYLFAHPIKLGQVFQNLISNAIKFQRPNMSPKIDIQCEEQSTHWQFSVSDNGIGIQEKYFGRIFLVFKRLHTKQKYEGTGIGLAICKKIIEQHGGTIWVQSDYGKGSTFFFTINKNNYNL